ncbi:MAG: small ribosomal subunit biogenesis GTPase RsgA [Gammaproteobacteria bacterium]|nr:small ribosomal subunit biogenesis GTPase RsgA [Gammaproteobacteria bacterium]MDH5728551.1 small ribosomal subunit biogenesis GTPase RsgA [Gammaproteobacteria bacterium]
MAKRKLNKRQAWRIEKIQQERIKRQQKKSIHLEDLNDDLGKEERGLIIANYGNNLIVEEQSGQHIRCQARQNLGAIVCGDQVVWQRLPNDEGVVVAVLERLSLLEKPGPRDTLKPVVANIDQIFVFSAIRPQLQFSLIDRYLVSAELAQINVIIVLNKIDLVPLEEKHETDHLLDLYRDMGYDVIYLSIKQNIGFEQLQAKLQNQVSILVGQSGVGKSSTIKKLLPDLDIQIGALTSKNELGKHTTSASRLYHLPTSGDIIDSPGVRDFGLWHLNKNRIIYGFKEFRPFIGQCKFSDCSHTHEPGCALLQAVQDGHIHPRRLQSYFHIMHTIVEKENTT